MELLFKILENKMQTKKPVVEGLTGTAHEWIVWYSFNLNWLD